jgi:predicted permease
MKSLWRRIRYLVNRRRREAEIDEELMFHLAEEAEERRDAGLPESEAARVARVSLGNITLVKEDVRSAWGLGIVETGMQDVRIALRGLGRSPGFTAAAITVLALGIGASTAVFSIVHAVLLKPLALKDPGRIEALDSLWTKDGHRGPVSIPDFRDWQAQNHTFESMAFYGGGEIGAVVGNEVGFAKVTAVSRDFFRTLGIEPLAGRVFDDRESAPGASGAAVISDAFWRAHLGGEVSAIGQPIKVGGRPVSITGIMPAGFGFPAKTDIWVPVDTVFRDPSPNRGGNNYQAVGRLRTGIALREARADMTVIGERLQKDYPVTNAGKNVAVTPIVEELTDSFSNMLYVLFGAVLLLLVISCGSVANLLLAKAASRAREMGLRAALGASRGRLVRQLATESLVLGLSSGAAGLVVAYFGTRTLVALAPAGIPRLEEIAMDGPVLAAAVLLTLGACLLFGLTPAFRAAGSDLAGSLKQGSRPSTGVGSLLRRSLVAAEIAFSVPLLIGAGLLIRSFDRLSGVALGFDTKQILVMDSRNLGGSPEELARVSRMYESLLAETARLPGVDAVGASRVPPGVVVSNGAYEVDRAADGGLSAKSPQAVYSIVSPGAFGALGIPIVQGRDFSDVDRLDGSMTAIVNETLARHAFPGGDAIGHSIVSGMDNPKPMTIVGVVRDIRQAGPGTNPQAEIYMPYLQHPGPATMMRILVRTSSPEPVMNALRAKAHQLRPEMPVKFTTMEARIAENTATPKFRTLLMAIFSGIAVVLTVVGLYGVVAFLVSRNTQEIGLRIALGASPSSVLQSVLSHGLRLAIVGLTIGLALAAAASRFLESLLFEVKPLDPATYMAVAVLTALVALGACVLPAWKATRIDPMVALRRE